MPKCRGALEESVKLFISEFGGGGQKQALGFFEC